MTLLWYFLAGFFAWNTIPHLVKGITGEKHMTPFKRVSSPMLNIVWAFTNLFLAMYMLGMAEGTDMFVWFSNANLTDINLWAFILGGLVTSFTAAWLFGQPNARLPWHKD